MLHELERGGHLDGGPARLSSAWAIGTRRADLLWHGAGGKQQTFALLDEWVPLTRSLPRDEALVELTERYFTSHGPATVQDLTHWAGLTVAEANAGLAAAGKTLIQETIADRVYWMPCEAPEIDHATPSVHLLPGFDEYLLGYRDRSAVLDPALRPTHLSRRQRHVQPDHRDRWRRHRHLETHLQGRRGGHRSDALPALDRR